MPSILRAPLEFWGAQRLATRILLVFLPLLLVPLVTIGGLAVSTMADLGDFALSATADLGGQASTDSRGALTDQAQESLHQLALDNAALSDAEFGRIAANVDSLSRYATGLWSAPPSAPTAPLAGESPPRTVEYLVAPEADPGAVARDLPLTRQMQPVLAALGENDPTVTGLFMGTESGIMQVFPSAEGLPAGYDPRDRSWYRSALQTNGQAWSEPYLDAAGRGLVTTISRMVVDGQGNPVGVVGIDVTNQGMSQRLGATRVGKRGYAFAIDGFGRVIIAPDLNSRSLDWSQAFVSENLFESDAPDVRALAARMIKEESGVAQVSFTDGVRYVGYAPLAANDWAVGVVAHVEDIVEPATRTDAAIALALKATHQVMDSRIVAVKSEFGLVLVVIVVIAAGITILLARTITRRLHRLGDAALALEQGDLSEEQIAELRASQGKDEVAALMRVFARMAEQVRTREEALRQQVQQLHIEIDHQKAEQQVAEITETDYFQELQAKAQAMRGARGPTQK